MEELRRFLQESKAQKERWEKEEGYPRASRYLRIPGLDLRFWLYREQWGRHFTRDENGNMWYRPTYEAVYFSKAGAGTDPRAMTKLIFTASADENERPLGVTELLKAIPEDMLEYLVETLKAQWAVVTFYHDAEENGFTVNCDRSELWEQEESNMTAMYRSEREMTALGPYMVVENERAYPAPGSPVYDWSVPHKETCS